MEIDNTISGNNTFNPMGTQNPIFPNSSSTPFSLTQSTNPNFSYGKAFGSPSPSFLGPSKRKREEDDFFMTDVDESSPIPTKRRNYLLYTLFFFEKNHVTLTTTCG